MSSHDRELGLEFVDAVLRRVRTSLGEVAIQDVPFVPLNPASGLEHSEEVAQEWCGIVFFDDADEVADVDDVVLLKKFFWW